MGETNKKKRWGIIDKIIIVLSLMEIIIIAVLAYHFFAVINLQ